ncbi:MAG: DUF1304 domain-containing protein [Acidobacteria bacterium]|nr:DUF1304 domain-containing protein [Acidobacteriota bacterium]
MSALFLVIGAVFVGVAAAIHVLIFALESVLWTRPTTWKRFGLRSQQDADTVRPMAYNQGFYNAFLALGGAASLVMIASANVEREGFTLAIFVCLSMLLASIVLITSNPRLARAAATQGVAPLLALVFLVLSLTS